MFYLLSDVFVGVFFKGDIIQYSVENTDLKVERDEGAENPREFGFNTSSQDWFYPMGGHLLVGYRYNAYEDISVVPYLFAGGSYISNEYMSSHFYGGAGIDIEINFESFLIFFGGGMYIPYMGIKRYNVSKASIEGENQPKYVEKDNPKSFFHLLPFGSIGFKVPLSKKFFITARYSYLFDVISAKGPEEKYKFEQKGTYLDGTPASLKPEVKLGGHSILFGIEYHNIIGG